jgi:hypothetical protein
LSPIRRIDRDADQITLYGSEAVSFGIRARGYRALKGRSSRTKNG